MQIGAKAKVHNKFEIKIIDAATNVVKREMTAYNTVLNQMYKDLIDNSKIFDSILIGTGTGTITPESAQLINLVMSKNVVGKKLNFTNFDGTEFNITAKIIVEAGELVGETITEVGVGTGTGSYANPETHAFLKDAEGNIIGITKSATEVLHIEATVYFNISLPEWVTDYVAFSNNDFDNPSEGAPFCTFLSDYVYNFFGPTYSHKLQAGNRYYGGSFQKNIKNKVKDYENKKVTLNYTRFESGEVNDFVPYFKINEENDARGLKLDLKKRNIATQTIADAEIGTGDGVTKDFVLPSRDIKTDSLIIKINGASTLGYELETKTDYSFCANEPLKVKREHYSSLKSSKVTGGYRISDEDVAITVSQNDWSGVKLAIMRNDGLIKKALFVKGVNSSFRLLYISDDFEDIVFYNSFNSTYDPSKIVHFTKTVVDGEVSYVEDKDKRLIVGASIVMSAHNSRDIISVNTSNRKIMKYSYNDEQKKYEVIEIPYTLDSTASGVYEHSLALDDDGVNLYSIYNNQLVKAEIPESGSAVFTKIADVEKNSAFCVSTEPTTKYSSDLIFSVSEKILTIRRNGSWNVAKTIPISGSEVSFSQINQNVYEIRWKNPKEVMIAEFDDENNLTLEKIPPFKIAGALSYPAILPKRVGDFFVSDVAISSNNLEDKYIGGYCSDKHIVHFTTPPPQGAVITASYDSLGITKTENWIIDVSLEISFSEGV